jgi:ATP-dependent DNA helicase RecQ
MPDPVRTILTERFGFRSLRPIQKEVVGCVMNGGHALVVMPTGSGKSLCYQLPALALPGPGVTLVFSPLIALMEDQVAALKNRKIKAEYINSTLSRRERDRRYARLGEGKYDLIYATPERMRKPEFVEALNSVEGGVKLLAVDEAHCIARWGHDLRPAYREVGRFRRLLGNPVTIALTATATARVRTEVVRTLGIQPERMPLFVTPIDRPNLSMESTEAWHDDDKVEKIKAVANPRGRTRGTGIIYFARIKDLEHFASLLPDALGRRKIEIYHGKLSPREKKKVYQRFIEAKPDDGLVLLATNAFGMGVDKADIRFIIHAQVPGSVEAYYQEVGRAGRDGRRARCLLLYDSDDLAIQQQFIEWSNPSADVLVRAAQVIEASPHADIDVDELQAEVAGKARTIPRGLLEHALISLEKRGIIEPTSDIGRYRFSRALEHGEVDPDAIARKRKRDLQRLHEVVKMTRCDGIREYVNSYFDLSGEPEQPRKKKRRRRRRRGRSKTQSSTAEAPKQATPKGPDNPDGAARKRRRRRRRGGRRRRKTQAA